MAELQQDIEEYLKMEKSSPNQDYWKATLIILNESQTHPATAPESRAVTSVADDINALLGSKSHDQLLTLESQVQRKLSSDEPVDVDYWQQLLRSLKIWKARARIRDFHVPFADRPKPAKRAVNLFSPEGFVDPHVVHDEMLEDNEAFTAAAQTMFDLETTRIVEEGVESEETFNVEDEEATANQPPMTWATEHNSRKPKFFNRVVMGYEWNKYNQTHYDESNPPPKVVQGYKFNIFYPNLVEAGKAPMYKVERNRQKRRYVGGGGGTSAGEDETCIIRFIAGPPYLDVAFRIIDRDRDYSSKFNRGFKSSFEKVCLPLFGK
jgi:Cactus-binding C-terminus of cactin protein/Conserved mid region of cactin